MTLSEYSHLKQQIVIGVSATDRHSRLLSSLKDLFKGVINSPRRFEQITTIGQLLYMLEIRDALSEDNVEPLKQIAQRLSNCNDLVRGITHYEASHVPREYKNYYDKENLRNTSVRELSHGIVNGNLCGPMSTEKKQRIIQTVVEEIGQSWRDLARNLGIREYDINFIDNSNSSLARKASEVLKLYFQKKAEPDKWIFDLGDALDKSRRKDLTKAIRKIQLMNI